MHFDLAAQETSGGSKFISKLGSETLQWVCSDLNGSCLFASLLHYVWGV